MATVSRQLLDRHHRDVEDLYRSKVEVLHMMEEELIQFDWLINYQQASDSFADEVVFGELRSQLENILKAKVDLENQIFLYSPRRV